MGVLSRFSSAHTRYVCSITYGHYNKGGPMWLWLIVIGSSIWVGYDSNLNKIPTDNKKPYSIGNGAIAWAFVCILLWIVAFPYYIYKRAQILKNRKENPKEETK